MKERTSNSDHSVYGVRVVGSKYFEYRISKTQRHLDSLNKQRDETIEKLKIATKYNSTQQLLDKYGGDSPKSKSGTGSKRKDAASKSNTPQMTDGRTGIPPPPTANIVRPPNTSGPSTPVRSPLGNEPDRHDAFGHHQMSHSPLPHAPSLNEPGFAPNAFPAPPQYNDGPRWYDRFMDVLLGEDESLPKNRLALICQNCRLINGQAPPGMNNLEELGRWRCGGCGAWNGEESEAKKVLANIKNQPSGTDGAWESVSEHVEEELSSAGAVTDDGVIIEKEMKDSESEEDANEIQEVPETDSESEKNPLRRSKRGRSKGNKKGETG
jgi:hypothetical protein